MNVISFANKPAQRPSLWRGMRWVGICLSVGMLAACAQPQGLYSWDSYQPMVHAYLKEEGEDYAAQVQTLEENVQSARATDQALPPGFRAHLGLLYLKLGDGAKAVEQWEGEKLAFPESSSFMNFLLRHTTAQADVAVDDQQKVVQ